VRTHKNEFPNYIIPASVLALVREGLLEDTSWHNDVSPSFEGYLPYRRVGVRLWVDHTDPALREVGGARFTVVRLKMNEWPGCSPEWIIDDDCPALLSTEDAGEAVGYPQDCPPSRGAGRRWRRSSARLSAKQVNEES
jgi:hypothetical protein